MLPRSSPSSLYRFKKRLLSAMPKGMPLPRSRDGHASQQLDWEGLSTRLILAAGEGLGARVVALSSWVGYGFVSDAAKTAKHNLGELATGKIRRAPAQVREACGGKWPDGIR
eukprot:scaffold3687_cov240-Pinguiococcus_pyrenoidosus.AAC.4